MKRIILSSTTYAIKAFLFGLLGATIILLIGAIRFLNDKPDLQLWHTEHLDQEYRSDSKVTTFEEYLALEERLFQQLDELVYSDGGADSANWIDRYTRSSSTDPTSWEPNWNRSFELKTDAPKAGILLLHGLSDSPYSLRAIGHRLHEAGAYVVGLRIPGHGTAPSALTQTTWQDMSAAVQIAMLHLKEQVGDQPLHLVGFSNGGALSLRYALETIEDAALPKLDSIALLSPEVGISPMAALAIWQERIGDLLRLKKLQWNAVQIEYDPYKYNSFPVNAGMLAHELTISNRSLLKEFSEQDKLRAFPSVIAFQSVVDATISAPALVRDLFARLPKADHELVIYDINRSARVEPLLREEKVTNLSQLEQITERLFTLSILTNESPQSEAVVVQTYAPMLDTPEVEALSMQWPPSVYSLSHVALPFSPEDPLYGPKVLGEEPRWRIGAFAIRGEKGIFSIPAADMLRQRWNPFYDYQETRILEHFKLR